MKVRRIAIHLLTACTLLVQGLAIAWSSPTAAVMMASSAATPMAHCHMAPASDPAQKDACCCADQCNCFEVCGASTGVLPGIVGVQFSFESGDQRRNPLTALLSVPLPVPLHPPNARS